MLCVSRSLIGSTLNISNSLIKTANPDTNNGVRQDVWKFRVLHGDEVLRDLIWHYVKGGGFMSPGAAFRLSPALLVSASGLEVCLELFRKTTVATVPRARAFLCNN
jgi:hypothetical protein